MKCNVEQRRHFLIATYYQLHNDSINVRTKALTIERVRESRRISVVGEQAAVPPGGRA
ncbi:hypothetical protein K0M31_006664 [Melipona bicolor]|uniref:Uncharacterized protein n=1 Tax=Melipona bicolor TaxID=60889 RepID=A0AA40KKZ1_9HYME|nr:hypothetical protein K0M31_006664 [Melipona bicolor]